MPNIETLAPEAGRIDIPTRGWPTSRSLTGPDRIRAYLAGAPTADAALWAAYALYRLTGDAARPPHPALLRRGPPPGGRDVPRDRVRGGRRGRGVRVTGLGVHYFGAREPLDVSTLLFYWQD